MSVNLFDVNFYRSANTDLASAGITTDAQLASHFQSSGLNQGRPFSPLVDLNFYRASNSDLSNFNNQQSYDHLRNNGIAEGRKFAPFFDLGFYKQSNSDLAGFSNEQLFDHLQNNGLNEKRNFSPFFSPSFYLANNSDLAQNNYGGRQLLEHYVLYGFNEGRPGVSDWVGNNPTSAAEVQVDSNSRFYSDSVGSTDSDDYYRLVINKPSNVEINITTSANSPAITLSNSDGRLISGVGGLNVKTSGNLNSFFNNPDEPVSKRFGRSFLFDGGDNSDGDGILSASSFVNVTSVDSNVNSQVVTSAGLNSFFTSSTFTNQSKNASRIVNTLQPGTYLLRFQAGNGNSNYGFSVKAI
ncbi:MAG: hypothetical protein KME64_36140 [Scytonematopsis contorta HA4267-MV1]|jgi:hypothetical protein|nr:hypothetical protein [Scytonematopsis contorta HA4267-MV1]